MQRRGTLLGHFSTNKILLNSFPSQRCQFILLQTRTTNRERAHSFRTPHKLPPDTHNTAGVKTPPSSHPCRLRCRSHSALTRHFKRRSWPCGVSDLFLIQRIAGRVLPELGTVLEPAAGDAQRRRLRQQLLSEPVGRRGVTVGLLLGLLLAPPFLVFH